MLIDWFTVVAQALNFLILVWLMRRFLYKPILEAIATREKKIADELADAATKKAEAQKDRDEFQRKNKEFDSQRADLLSKATDEAKSERTRLLEEARKAADALSTKRQESLKNDIKALKHSITRRTQDEVFAITRKVLKDLASSNLESSMVDLFVRHLRGMDGKTKETFGSSVKTASVPAIVRSAFDLQENECLAIQKAVNETFSVDSHLLYETAPDLIGGIELTANGQKVAWSIADYLVSMEKGIDELLNLQDRPESEPTPKTTPEAKPETAPDDNPVAEPEAVSKPKLAQETSPQPISTKESKATQSPTLKTKAKAPESDPLPASP